MPIYLVGIKLEVKEIEAQDAFGQPCKMMHEVQFAENGRDLLDVLQGLLEKQSNWLQKNIPQGDDAPPRDSGDSKVLVMPGFSREKEKKVE